MPTSSFVVRLSDLEHGPKRVTFELTPAWLGAALADTDASPVDEPGTVSVELMKNDRDVLVRGSARVSVTVPCVVTLEPLRFELTPEILMVLEPKAEAPGKGKKPKREPSPKRKARAEDDLELSEEDAARDTFTGDEIVLDGFVREFILLEIPAYPRRSDLPSPEESLSSRPLAGPAEEAKPIDPRLAPLQGILERLRGQASKE